MPPAATVNSAASSGIVEVPISSPAESSETTVPEIVTAEPLGETVVSGGIVNPVGAAVMV
ncbi:hypothetical protein ABVK25_005115 [Lepraria finkii]|uniref:Uncharacterized protein n=1 Tax=Lepraria finkii TaxID=1340010 RepID=A0ABR4BD88_9LECA